MPTYRVEEASTGRATCKNKECQVEKEHIPKGELRLGSWVETEQFQSWAWKHWGCVTPKQVATIQELVGENGDYDMSLLDGFDELSTENQEKIREATMQGHVADSDWRGDIEVNRPGKIGFRVRVSKKKASKADSAKDSEPKQAAKRKRGKQDSNEEADEDDNRLPPKKGKATKKNKVKSQATDESAAEESAAEASENDEELPEKKQATRRGAKSKPKQVSGAAGAVGSPRRTRATTRSQSRTK
ncbi:hypothetical protein FQN57_007065 [Myotisia sp. PD_48]|nr:hypothetical protein FQN57_007065 [Myotisia sp. PD_48]